MAGRSSLSTPLARPPSAAPADPLSRIAATTPDLQMPPAPTKLISYFTQSQLALALAIQKSKPQDVSTKDYCLQLRKNIQSHREPAVEKHRYIDTCEFWKDQYMRIYQEKSELEDKVHQLEQVQQTRDELGVANLDNEIISNHPGKRRRSPQDVQGSLDVQRSNPSPDDDSDLMLSRYVLRIGRQRSHLEKCMKESNIPDYLDNLAKLSHQTLRLLETVLSDCIIPLWSLRCSDNTQRVCLLRQVMHQIVLSFRASFHALNELCHTILGRAKRFDTIYRLVMFFKIALDHLHTVCTLQAENEIAERRRTRSKRVKIEDEYAVNKYLCEALISIAQIEWKVELPGHSDVWEGILFSILDFTGRLVSNAVFNEHVAMSDHVGNITKEGPALLPEAAKLESRYIVLVLRAALGGSNARKELVARILSAHPAKPDVPSRHGSLQASADHTHNLLIKARKTMQQTLVKSAVGGERLEGLRLPQPPEDDSTYSSQADCCVEKFGQEWLLESVWALIGWELAV